MTCLAPITPQLASRAAAFFELEELSWALLTAPLGDHEVAQFQPLLKRVDLKKLQKHLTNNQSQETPMTDTTNDNNPSPSDVPALSKAEAAAAEAAALEKAGVKPQIKIDDFMKLDLRTVTIVNAEAVEGSDKLIKTTVDIGNDVTRTIFAGMKTAYQPEDMIGRKVLALVNLKPRKMRFGTSEGMLLGAGPGDKDIFLLTPDEGATTGMAVS